MEKTEFRKLLQENRDLLGEILSEHPEIILKAIEQKPEIVMKIIALGNIATKDDMKVLQNESRMKQKCFMKK